MADAGNATTRQTLGESERLQVAQNESLVSTRKVVGSTGQGEPEKERHAKACLSFSMKFAYGE